MRSAVAALARGVAAAAAVAITATAGCDQVLGLSPRTLGTLDAGGAPDADAGAPDAPSSSIVPCLSDGGAAPGYHDLSSSACWTTFSAESLGAVGFTGGAFDGRYVYIGPGLNSTCLRYDTQAEFTSLSGWSSFDLSRVGPQNNTYDGVVFDGRFLYFVPAPSGMGVTVRYDTQGTFTTASAWAKLDLSSLDQNGIEFVGGAFDGRYVYYAPYEDGVVARYDTQGPFAIGSFATFDTGQIDQDVDGFAGAVFDGRYVTFAPGGGNGVVARFDTKGTFDKPSSWATYDLTDNVTPAASAFEGAAFDGAGLYFAPDVTSGNGGPAVRYALDGGSGFSNASSWSAFSPAGLESSTQTTTYIPTYGGSLFDGRFVYFIPTSPSGGEDNALLLRYDTTAAGGFNAMGAWALFDTTRVDSNALDFAGGVFDGRYIYLSPQGSLIVRFDARAPGPLPVNVGLPSQAQYGSSSY